MPHATDPRITELLDLAAEEGQPLALTPETICALEDQGYLVDPFTGAFLPDPDAPTPAPGQAQHVTHG